MAWVSLAPLLVALGLEHAARPAPARVTWKSRSQFFFLGWLTGFVGFTITVYWVAGVMAQYGGFSSWLALPIGALLWAYLGVFTGTAAWVTGRAIRRFGVIGVWTFPVTWVAMEWARSWPYIGFPWAFLGTSQAHVLPVVQLASVTGVYGLSLIVVLVSTAVAAVTLSLYLSQRGKVSLPPGQSIDPTAMTTGEWYAAGGLFAVIALMGVVILAQYARVLFALRAGVTPAVR